MSVLSRLYRPSLALLTDLYELTMAYGYWKLGVYDKTAVFHLFFRKNPFQGGYAIACGLDYVVDFLENLSFDEEDRAYLAGLKGNDGKPLFEQGFLDYLRDTRFTCDIDAVPEGTVVFPHEPLLRVTGPICHAQILESALLNIINFQTLIATKAARVCQAAQGEPVLEFGLRRAQGVDGALTASRAAYIGGCAATSNVLAGRLYDIPVKGTHAHSWVMSFDSELEAFERYAEVMPNNCVFLVDTYSTLEGVRHAVQVGRKLRERGYQLAGIRLDSGDLAYLSIEARKILDEAGFQKTAIVASNDLDEHLILDLKLQGARIDTWGVGTKLATAFDQPALGGVYKLSAIRRDGEPWRYKVKLSEQVVKVSNPGILQVRRFRSGEENIADMIYDLERGPLSPDSSTQSDSTLAGIDPGSPSSANEGTTGGSRGAVIIDPLDLTRRKFIPEDMPYEDLLVPVFRDGQRVYQLPTSTEARQRAQKQLAMFHSGVKRFANPHQYPVGLEKTLFDLKTRLILKARGAQS